MTTRSRMFTIPGTAVERFDGPTTGRTYELFIMEPEGAEDRRLPTLYLLDANWLFGAACELVRLMWLVGEVPPLRLVGVGYPEITSPVQIMAVRTRDLTPTCDDGIWSSVEALWPEAAGFAGTGQAEAFGRELREAIVPHVEAQRPVEGQARGIVGYSLGGLFALHQLIEHSETFQRYVMISPSLWWDEEQVFDKAVRWTPEPAHLDVLRLFVSVGELEEPPPGEPGIPMVTEVRRLDELLRARAGAGLCLETLVLAGETHFAGAAAALSRGLRSVLV